MEVSEERLVRELQENGCFDKWRTKIRAKFTNSETFKEIQKETKDFFTQENRKYNFLLISKPNINKMLNEKIRKSNTIYPKLEQEIERIVMKDEKEQVFEDIYETLHGMKGSIDRSILLNKNQEETKRYSYEISTERDKLELIRKMKENEKKRKEERVRKAIEERRKRMERLQKQREEEEEKKFKMYEKQKEEERLKKEREEKLQKELELKKRKTLFEEEERRKHQQHQQHPSSQHQQQELEEEEKQRNIHKKKTMKRRNKKQSEEFGFLSTSSSSSDEEAETEEEETEEEEEEEEEDTEDSEEDSEEEVILESITPPRRLKRSTTEEKNNNSSNGGSSSSSDENGDEARELSFSELKRENKDEKKEYQHHYHYQNPMKKRRKKKKRISYSTTSGEDTDFDEDENEFYFPPNETVSQFVKNRTNFEVFKELFGSDSENEGYECSLMDLYDEKLIKQGEIVIFNDVSSGKNKAFRAFVNQNGLIEYKKKSFLYPHDFCNFVQKRELITEQNGWDRTLLQKGREIMTLDMIREMYMLKMREKEFKRREKRGRKRRMKFEDNRVKKKRKLN